MLYLEDYLEMIEHLPQELRDRFTEMREMDLSVQNIMDTLEKRSKVFFNQCRRNEIHGTAADNAFDILKKDYYKILEDADEKVSLASTMHELVEKYLRRLDSELFKFKCELEADNNGITEVLEKRSLELDGNNRAQISLVNQKENRYFGSIANNNFTQIQKDKLYRQKPEKRRDSISVNTSIAEKKSNSNNLLMIQTSCSSATGQTIRCITPNMHSAVINNIQAKPNSNLNVNNTQTSTQNLSDSLAIVPINQISLSTQQLQQNRKSIMQQNSNNVTDIIINREVNSSNHVIAVVNKEQALSQRKQKKKLSSTLPFNSINNSSISTGHVHTVSLTTNINSVIMEPDSSRLTENGMVIEQTIDGEWTYDPNEPRYCICNQVSYGDMVACDNEACPFEWFHYPCVGITQSPKGKWYCPKCTQSMRRRNRKY